MGSDALYWSLIVVCAALDFMAARAVGAVCVRTRPLARRVFVATHLTLVAVQVCALEGDLIARGAGVECTPEFLQLMLTVLIPTIAPPLVFGALLGRAPTVREWFASACAWLSLCLVVPQVALQFIPLHGDGARWSPRLSFALVVFFAVLALLAWWLADGPSDSVAHPVVGAVVLAGILGAFVVRGATMTLRERWIDVNCGLRLFAMPGDGGCSPPGD